MLLITSISTSAEKKFNILLRGSSLGKGYWGRELHENVITDICINTTGESDFPVVQNFRVWKCLTNTSRVSDWNLGCYMGKISFGERMLSWKNIPIVNVSYNFILFWTQKKVFYFPYTIKIFLLKLNLQQESQNTDLSQHISGCIGGNIHRNEAEIIVTRRLVISKN